MKKLILLGMAALLCLPLTASATSIGGAETQGQGKLGVGFDSSFIFNQDFKSQNVSVLGASSEIKDVKINEGYEELSKISYGLLDWLDVYARLGAATGDSKENVHNAAGVQTYTAKSNGDWGFAWGLGLKAEHPLKDNWLIGCDLQYLWSGSGARASYTNINTSVVTSTTYKSVVEQEWHVAPYVGYRFGSLVPYFGVRYSDLRAIAQKPADPVNFDKVRLAVDDNVGVFVGTDYKIGDHWTLNIEGRFVDETALSVGATYRF